MPHPTRYHSTGAHDFGTRPPSSTLRLASLSPTFGSIVRSRGTNARPMARFARRQESGPETQPQGFLCWVESEVDEYSVAMFNGRDRVDVAAPVYRPMIGNNPVPGPYLFLRAVGFPNGETGYQCLEGYMQAIVAGNCLVPVDSHNERRKFGSLRTAFRFLCNRFPGTNFEFEKPLFDIETS